jgi:hypothetical protein
MGLFESFAGWTDRKLWHGCFLCSTPNVASASGMFFLWYWCHDLGSLTQIAPWLQEFQKRLLLYVIWLKSIILNLSETEYLK